MEHLCCSMHPSLMLTMSVVCVCESDNASASRFLLARRQWMGRDSRKAFLSLLKAGEKKENTAS